jgi:hypothetical protein
VATRGQVRSLSRLDSKVTIESLATDANPETGELITSTASSQPHPHHLALRHRELGDAAVSVTAWKAQRELPPCDVHIGIVRRDFRRSKTPLQGH